jgi:hypothetical protein
MRAILPFGIEGVKRRPAAPGEHLMRDRMTRFLRDRRRFLLETGAEFGYGYHFPA